MSTLPIQREPHLVGKFITVVYRIEDPDAWRKTNPLDYAHDVREGFGSDVQTIADSALDSDDTAD